ncbi:ATP-binding cassette domain-containing protein [Motiliproteus sp. SC1-56]|uniref:ABC transporter ATP-binding protein n=1 Tax=Motiliproteus sp. SC1-56 TaxID=2799565 RepID=UPI001A8C98A6|nr:ATP-binding cassette domain-containing protein [Motiliproteus sp. SC1-56]
MTFADRTPLLEVRGLKKNFGRRTLFEIDQLALQAGEACLLSGRNGAGKTTLMRILAGLEPCDEGTLYYRGQPLRTGRRGCLGGRVIYLHQQPCLFDASVEKNLAFGLRHLSRQVAGLRVEQALAWSGLGHLAARNARTLSGGEKQRIALARAWVLDPELLLLDEPTANMDSEALEQTLFLVRRLINEGTAILLCCHDLRSEQRLVHRRLTLRDGTLREDALALTPMTPARGLPVDTTQPSFRQITEA